MPSTVTAVRHGQSESNAAFDEALSKGVGIALTRPDGGVSLSPLGREQATELGRRLAGEDPPDLVLCSPYLRAVQTWELVAAELDASPEVRLDARFGDHEMGEWSGMNMAAIRERFPEESENLRSRMFAGWSPPGGESFPDVADRLREALEESRAEHTGSRVLIVAHDSVVLILRHVIEGVPMNALEEFIPVRNASVSVWRDSKAEVFNDTGHLRRTSF
ncbi:histidine phosphatase family protein [Streptosporangium lutulentum]|uniref:Broad specificity phosphatase PhoE n=1 Tax=Streptosporangium lutulentum TaxID=1461250 RepID=A0ABT9Q3N0_9ACTN|nr:histidine phosphatase family protein [Streptosporangium lutulentum]MDP9841317.1 broad specificity phosphatase PhoE [Streptosporangium lutulentum]